MYNLYYSKIRASIRMLHRLDLVIWTSNKLQIRLLHFKWDSLAIYTQLVTEP